MHGHQISAVDRWREKEEASRSEAIRRLVELGLKAKGK
jgi:metal-responsive CopG/Arc/MetJ family transcriptional regulator